MKKLVFASVVLLGLTMSASALEKKAAVKTKTQSEVNKEVRKKERQA